MAFFRTPAGESDFEIVSIRTDETQARKVTDNDLNDYLVVD